MKLWVMLFGATPDRQVTLESSDKTRSTGEANGNPLQYSYQENFMNSNKGKKIEHRKTDIAPLQIEKGPTCYEGRAESNY